MADTGYLYSINNFPGDGSTVSYEISFAGGYISREHVFARIVTGDILEPVGLTFTNDFNVVVDRAAPIGSIMQIYRSTPKDTPLANFTDGAIITEKNLDTNAQQAVFIAAEAQDASTISVKGDRGDKGDAGGSVGLVGLAAEITPSSVLPEGIDGVRTSGALALGVGNADFAVVADTGQTETAFTRRFSNAVVEVASPTPTLSQLGLNEAAANNASAFDAAAEFCGSKGRMLTGEGGRSYRVGQRSGVSPSFNFGPRLTPSVSFDGGGVEFSNSASGSNGSKALLAWGEPTAFAKVINVSPTDPILVRAGQNAVYVSDVRAFSIGDTVLLRLYSNPIDTPESLCWVIAKVTLAAPIDGLSDYSMGGSPVAYSNAGLVSFDDFIPRSVTNAIMQASPDAGYSYDGDIPFGSRYLYKLDPRNNKTVGNFVIKASDTNTFSMGLDTRHGRFNTILPIAATNPGAGAVVPQYQSGLLIGDVTVDRGVAQFHDGGIGVRMAETDGIGTTLRANTEKQALGIETSCNWHQQAIYDVDNNISEGERIALVSGADCVLSIGAMVRRGTGSGSLNGGQGVTLIGHLSEKLARAPYQTGTIGREITGAHVIEADGVVEVYSAAHGIVVDEVIPLDDNMFVYRFGPAGIVTKLTVYTNADAGDITTASSKGFDTLPYLEKGADKEVPIAGSGRIYGGSYTDRAVPLTIAVGTASGRSLAGSGKFIRIRAIVIPDMKQAGYTIDADRILKEGGRNFLETKKAFTVTVPANSRSEVLILPLAGATYGDFGQVSSAGSLLGMGITNVELTPNNILFRLTNSEATEAVITNMMFYGKATKRTLGV